MAGNASGQQRLRFDLEHDRRICQFQPRFELRVQPPQPADRVIAAPQARRLAGMQRRMLVRREAKGRGFTGRIDQRFEIALDVEEVHWLPTAYSTAPATQDRRRDRR